MGRRGTDEFLEHFGVKGMRWGVTRSKSSKGKSDDDSDDSKAAKAAKKKSVSSMSNRELQDLNKRLQLEKQYRDLNPKTNHYKQGKKVVNEAVWMANTASQVYTFTQSPVGKLLIDSMKK